jgi:hypothetical protein
MLGIWVGVKQVAWPLLLIQLVYRGAERDDRGCSTSDTSVYAECYSGGGTSCNSNRSGCAEGGIEGEDEHDMGQGEWCVPVPLLVLENIALWLFDGSLIGGRRRTTPLTITLRG